MPPGLKVDVILKILDLIDFFFFLTNDDDDDFF